VINDRDERGIDLGWAKQLFSHAKGEKKAEHAKGQVIRPVLLSFRCKFRGFFSLMHYVHSYGQERPNKGERPFGFLESRPNI